MTTRHRIGSALIFGLIASRAIAANPETLLLSVTPQGHQGTGESYNPSISANGRYVAFGATANNLVPNDDNGLDDIFVLDRETGAIERVSVSSSGTEANGESFNPFISADSRVITFMSSATNLVSGVSNGLMHVFAHDRTTGTTEEIDVSDAGDQANGASGQVMPSADGHLVAFASGATNLVPGDANAHVDVFVRDRSAGTTELVSVTSSGTQGNNDSVNGSISGDGRYVLFGSTASNLVSGDTNAASDVFVHDRLTGSTERVSVDSSGQQANAGAPSSNFPSISADGRFVVFSSQSTSLVPNDTNGLLDVFLHDRQTGSTERVSVDSNGLQSDDHSFQESINADGKVVTFLSSATNLVSGDTNGRQDVFLFDVQTGSTERVSVATDGSQGDSDSGDAQVSGDGRLIVFDSTATNLVQNDQNGAYDVFLRDRNPPAANEVTTPSGSAVAVQPIATLPDGTQSPIDLTFDSVQTSGTTTVLTSATPDGGAPSSPTNFTVGSPPIYYDVSTTANYSGHVSLCFGWQEGQFVNEANIRLLHYTSDQWQDVTTTVDSNANRVCGQVSSFSPFGLFERSYTFSGFFQPVDNPPTRNTVKAGSAIPVKFSLGGNQGLSIFSLGYPASQTIQCTSNAPMAGIEETVSVGSSSLAYDASTGQYRYVWKSDKSWANSCRRLVLKLNDGSQHTADFGFTK